MSTDDKPTPQSATEEAKQRAGAAPMPAPHLQPIGGPAAQQPAPGVPPGAFPPGYYQPNQAVPGQALAAPQPGMMIPAPQPGQPASGVPMQQFMQGQPGAQGRTHEDMRGDLQVLAAAQKAQAEVQQAPPPEQTEEVEEERPPLLRSSDEEMLRALDHFNNVQRRKKLEAGLDKMNVQDIILHHELKQRVKVSCGIVVTFRTITGRESQAILDDLGSQKGSGIYLEERLALMNLTAGIRALGDEVLPDHMVDRKFSTEVFAEKFERVLDFPVQLLADLRVNYYWFDDRVRNVMIQEELGNG